ncbi:MAG: ArsJ-associated glyceraldehyde-3-phosphate dehydrogenase [Rhodospirillaceae bacterium]
MTFRIALNGFGRMGKLFTRALWDQLDLEIIAINDPKASADIAAHLLEFDTVHGRWDREISAAEDGSSITIAGKQIPWTQLDNPAALTETGGWSKETVDLVVECSGKFKDGPALAPFLDHGVPRILVSAPVKDGSALNLVQGVNHDLYDPAQHRIVTAASCTTNCLAPVVKVVHESIGIVHGSMTTIHDVTNTQTIVDAPHKDKRRARSALNSLVPTTTGSATAITMIYPELKGKLNGHAVRVPLLNASLTDCVFELSRPTTPEELNGLFEAAAKVGPLKGILGYESRPLVSTDYRDDPRSSIIDGLSTMVINGTQAKIYAWYDNEWGYVNRMVDLAKMIAAGGR